MCMRVGRRKERGNGGGEKGGVRGTMPARSEYSQKRNYLKVPVTEHGQS